MRVALVSRGGLGLRVAEVPLSELGCSGVNYRLLNDVETVFVFVTFRCTPQFAGNQHKTDYGEEEDCSHDHAVKLSKICTTSYARSDFMTTDPCWFLISTIFQNRTLVNGMDWKITVRQMIRLKLRSRLGSFRIARQPLDTLS